MKELMGIFVPSMALIYLSDRCSIYETDRLGNKRIIKKECFFYVIATISMAIFVGLRTWYNDTVTYIQGYEMTNINGSVFENVNWSLGYNPGFILIRNILKYFGITTQNFIMLFALVTICLYMWFIRKYTDKVWLTIFLFFTMGCYTFTMAAIKQCVAVAFCLIATDCALKGKWKSFIIWILIGALFHPYALMYLIIPFLMFKPWTKGTYWMLVIFVVIGLTLQLLLGTIISITTVMGEGYNIEDFSSGGVNVFRFAVVCVPVLISYVIKEHLIVSEDKEVNLIINLSTLNALIMFVALFGTANYFARLANYFLIFQTIALPKLFNYFSRNSRKILILISGICYFAYFYYSNVISQPFDAQFDYIGIREYLSIMFNK